MKRPVPSPSKSRVTTQCDWSAGCAALAPSRSVPSITAGRQQVLLTRPVVRARAQVTSGFSGSSTTGRSAGRRASAVGGQVNSLNVGRPRPGVVPFMLRQRVVDGASPPVVGLRRSGRATASCRTGVGRLVGGSCRGRLAVGSVPVDSRRRSPSGGAVRRAVGARSAGRLSVVPGARRAAAPSESGRVTPGRAGRCRGRWRARAGAARGALGRLQATSRNRSWACRLHGLDQVAPVLAGDLDDDVPVALGGHLGLGDAGAVDPLVDDLAASSRLSAAGSPLAIRVIRVPPWRSRPSSGFQVPASATRPKQDRQRRGRTRPGCVRGGACLRAMSVLLRGLGRAGLLVGRSARLVGRLGVRRCRRRRARP